MAAAAERHPGVDVRQASAEALPFRDGRFDAALAQLVVHFMSDPVAGLREMARVTAPGGVVVACVWDHAGGTGPLGLFWSVAHELDPGITDESASCRRARRPPCRALRRGRAAGRRVHHAGGGPRDGRRSRTGGSRSHAGPDRQGRMWEASTRAGATRSVTDATPGWGASRSRSSPEPGPRGASTRAASARQRLP